MGIRDLVGGLVSRLRFAFAMGPMEIGLCLIAWLVFAWAIQVDTRDSHLIVTKVTFAIGTALPVIYAASFSLQRGGIGFGVRWLISGAALLVALALTFCVAWDTRYSPAQVTCTVLASLGVMVALPRQFKFPYRNYHRFLVTFIGRFGATFLVCAILVLGVNLALLALDAIYDLNFSHRVYLQVVGIVAIVMFPALIVGDIPALVEQVDADQAPTSEGGLRATRFVFIPLLVLYLILALLYLLRQVSGGVLEAEILAMVVIGAAFLAWLAQDMYARQIEANADGFAKVLRVLPWVLVPVLVISIVMTAIEQAGQRYDSGAHLTQVISAGFVVAFIASIVQYRKGGGPSLVMPRLATAVGAMILAWGGPFSMMNQEVRATIEEVREQATLAGVIRADGSCISAEEYEELQNQKQELGRFDEASSALGLLPTYGWRLESPALHKRAARALGCDLSLMDKIFEYRDAATVDIDPAVQIWRNFSPNSSNGRYARVPEGDLFVVRAYPNHNYDAQVLSPLGNFVSVYTPETMTLTLRLDEEPVVSFDLRTLLTEGIEAADALQAAATAAGDSGAPSFGGERLPEEFARLESEGVTLILDSVAGYHSKQDRTFELASLTGFVVFSPSLDEWRAGGAPDEDASETPDASADDAKDASPDEAAPTLP